MNCTIVQVISAKSLLSDNQDITLELWGWQCDPGGEGDKFMDHISMSVQKKKKNNSTGSDPNVHKERTSEKRSSKWNKTIFHCYWCTNSYVMIRFFFFEWDSIFFRDLVVGNLATLIFRPFGCLAANTAWMVTACIMALAHQMQKIDADAHIVLSYLVFCQTHFNFTNSLE